MDVVARKPVWLLAFPYTLVQVTALGRIATLNHRLVRGDDHAVGASLFLLSCFLHFCFK